MPAQYDRPNTVIVEGESYEFKHTISSHTQRVLDAPLDANVIAHILQGTAQAGSMVNNEQVQALNIRVAQSQIAAGMELVSSLGSHAEQMKASADESRRHATEIKYLTWAMIALSVITTGSAIGQLFA